MGWSSLRAAVARRDIDRYMGIRGDWNSVFWGEDLAY